MHSLSSATNSSSIAASSVSSLTIKPCSSKEGELSSADLVKDYYNKYLEFVLQRSEFTTEEYWDETAPKFIDWYADPDKNRGTATFKEVGMGQRIDWFKSGKLNACYNCVDRHVLAGRGDKIAIYYEGDVPTDAYSLTYNQLLDRVSRLSNAFKSMGIGKGDCITIYMPNNPDLITAMFACSRIGAIHSVVFGGFSAESLKQRISDSNSKIIITAPGFWRGGKQIILKDNIDAALSDKEISSLIRQVIWAEPSMPSRKLNANERSIVSVNEAIQQSSYPSCGLEDLLKKQSNICPCLPMASEDPLFVLYSSGSTGKPKGLLHTTGGYLVAACMSQTVFNPLEKKDFVHFCTANMGWVTGHTYGAYSLSMGHSLVLHEGTPIYPSPTRWFDMIIKYKANSFYTAPTALRLLRQHNVQSFLSQYSFPSLKILGSAGEPLDSSTAIFFLKEVGKNKILLCDTYWQTELGSIVFVRAYPKDFSLKSTDEDILQFSLPGAKFAVVDDAGKPITKPYMHGNLVLRFIPYPSLARTIINDAHRYIKTYFSRFPGNYNTGDSAYYDNRGNMHIVGRVDDAFNVSGHLIGSAEMEEAIGKHSNVAASAVVARPDKLFGATPFVCVTLKDGKKDDQLSINDKNHLFQQLIDLVGHDVGTYARPRKENVMIVEALPITGSGKVVRRIIRDSIVAYLSGTQPHFNDLSTLSDPNSAEKIKGAIFRHLESLKTQSKL